MKNRQKNLIIILSLAVMFLAACANSANESRTESNNLSPTIDSDQDESADSSDRDEIKSEDASDAVNGTDETSQEDISDDTYDNSDDEEVSVSNDNNNETIDNKTDYLEKLNQMEEADRFAEAKETISELEEQEEERYQKWDRELNQIYGILTEQLSTEKMDELRDEQRDWIVSRDETAKEASLEYEGGTTEALEYVATQATLTRERCYFLVAQYLE